MHILRPAKWETAARGLTNLQAVRVHASLRIAGIEVRETIRVPMTLFCDLEQVP